MSSSKTTSGSRREKSGCSRPPQVAKRREVSPRSARRIASPCIGRFECFGAIWVADERDDLAVANHRDRPSGSPPAPRCPSRAPQLSSGPARGRRPRYEALGGRRRISSVPNQRSEEAAARLAPLVDAAIRDAGLIQTELGTATHEASCQSGTAAMISRTSSTFSCDIACPVSAAAIGEAAWPRCLGAAPR